MTAAVLLALALSACGGAVATPLPSPSPSPPPTAPLSPSPSASLSPSPSPTPQPSPSPAVGFYLRASYSQALPPNLTFNWLPVLTIDGGTAIDGNVAVPAIFPGPLVIVPNARSISEAAIAAIVDEARRLGLLGDMTDFTGGGAMPGSRLGQLRIVVDGQPHDLVGNPDALVRCDGGRCEAEPGTPAAFAAFWQELSNLDAWLGDQLGAPVAYQPQRIAVLFGAPARPEPGLEQQLMTWPLEESFLEVGVEFPGQAGTRCVTLSGDDLNAVMPLLLNANQLTVFHDAVDTTSSLVVAVLVPGQDSPCPDVVDQATTDSGVVHITGTNVTTCAS